MLVLLLSLSYKKDIFLTSSKKRTFVSCEVFLGHAAVLLCKLLEGKLIGRF